MNAVFIRADPHDVNQPVLQAAQASCSAFDQLLLLCWNHKGLPLPKSEVADAATIERFGFVLSSGILRDVIGVICYQTWVLRHLLGLRPQLVQAFDFSSLVPAVVARLLTGCIVVYDVRDPLSIYSGFRPAIEWLAGWIDRFLMGFCCGFVLPKEASKTRLGGWARSKRPTVAIENTCCDVLQHIEAMKFDDIPPRRSGKDAGGRSKKVRIACVGRPGCSNEARRLIESGKAAQAGLELWLTCDPGPASQDKQPKAADNIKLWPRCSRNKALALMWAADIVAIPHDNNAPANQAVGPDVLYESLMLGTPVLVREGAEQSELVRREELGYVVNYNHPQELKDVLKSLGNTRKHDQMRRRCRRYFLQNLTLADELDKYGRFYRSLIDRQPIPNGNQRT